MKRKTRLLLTVTLVLVSLCGTTLYVSCTPKTAEGFVKRGYAYEEKGELDMAIADYTEAIRLNPNNAWTYSSRARIYREKGDLDKSIADYSKAIHGGIYVEYRKRGDAYYEIGDYNSAIADYEAYLQISPGSEAVEEKLKKAKYAKESAEFQQAIAEYTETIRLNPKNADAYFKRGYQYYMKIPDTTNLHDLQKAIISIFISRDLDQAIADFEAAVRINPNHADARKYLENARQLRGY